MHILLISLSEELVPAAAVLSTGTSKCIPDDKDNITTSGTHSRDHPYAADTKKPEKPSFYLVDNQGSSLELEPARDSVKKAHITVIDTQYSDATGANMPAGGNTDGGEQSADGTGADMPSGGNTDGGVQSADDTQSGCDVVMAADYGMVDGKMDISEEDTLGLYSRKLPTFLNIIFSILLNTCILLNSMEQVPLPVY